MSNARNDWTERRRAVEELRALYDRAEGRELTADEEATERRLDQAIQDLDARVSTELRRVRLDELTAARAELAPELRELTEGKDVSVSLPLEARDLTAGTATDGAELVNDSTRPSIWDVFEASDPLLAEVTVLKTRDANDLVVPYVTSHSSASIIAEASAISESDPQFSTKTLSPFKYAFLTQVSFELLKSDRTNLVPFLVSQGVEACGRAFAADIAAGVGSTEPVGLTSATSAVTAASATVVTLDELLTVRGAVLPEYRNDAVWVMNDTTLAELLVLKDADNRYMVQPSPHLGAPDSLFGHRIVVSASMPDTATGLKPIAFGNLKRGYASQVVGSVDVQRSDSYAFNTALSTWRFILQADGALVDPAAVRVITML